MLCEVHRVARTRAIRASVNWEAAIRRVPYIQNCRVKSLDRTVAIWLPRQIVWRICQTNPPKRPIGSTLDQKVPGSIPGGAIISAAVTYE